MFILRVIIVFWYCVMSSVTIYALPEKIVPVDSRIKTFVYNENEIFRIVVHYGYQTSIEFEEDEEIQNISTGNDYAWVLTPVNKRLFIRPLEENILTNMTIITNQRVYHLEIQSKMLSYSVDEELVYVVRFFYPDVKNKNVANNSAITQIKEQPYNFDYTLSGPDAIAPSRVFDDGKTTFFGFSPYMGVIPSISAKNGSKIIPLNFKQAGQYLSVDMIASEFEIHASGGVVKIFNEKMQRNNGAK